MKLRHLCGAIAMLILPLSFPAKGQEVLRTAKEIGSQFVQGILQANFREMPLDEILSLQQTALPRVALHASSHHPSLLFRPSMAGILRSRQYQMPSDVWASFVIESASTPNRRILAALTVFFNNSTMPVPDFRVARSTPGASSPN